LQHINLSDQENLHGTRDHYPTSACWPSPSCQRQANLGPQDRDEGIIDMTVQSELTEDVSVLFAPLLKRLAAIRGNSSAVNEDENKTSNPLRRSFISSSPRRYRRW
jgi:hypothetical protein